jgi:hypothetical protein
VFPSYPCLFASTCLRIATSCSFKNIVQSFIACLDTLFLSTNAECIWHGPFSISSGDGLYSRGSFPRNFCCLRSLLFHNCGILNFCGLFLDNCCLCIPQLLGCERRSCHNCGIFSFGYRTCFICHLLVIAFVCCCTRLCHLRICLLCPLSLILFLA